MAGSVRSCAQIFRSAAPDSPFITMTSGCSANPARNASEQSTASMTLYPPRRKARVRVARTLGDPFAFKMTCGIGTGRRDAVRDLARK